MVLTGASCGWRGVAGAAAFPGGDLPGEVQERRGIHLLGLRVAGADGSAMRRGHGTSVEVDEAGAELAASPSG
jgi:hypothetical protein